MSEDMKSRVNVDNYIDNDLTNPQEHLDWGKWEQAPVKCPGFKKTNPAFYSEGAEGSMTGTQGWVQYEIKGTDYSLHITWDVPYSGGNSFGASVVPSGAPFSAKMTGPSSGNDNTFVVALNHKISLKK